MQPFVCRHAGCNSPRYAVGIEQAEQHLHDIKTARDKLTGAGWHAEEGSAKPPNHDHSDLGEPVDGFEDVDNRLLGL